MNVHSVGCEACQIEMIYLEEPESLVCERCGGKETSYKERDVPVEELLVWAIKRLAYLEDQVASYSGRNDQAYEPSGVQPGGQDETPFVQARRDKDILN